MQIAFSLEPVTAGNWIRRRRTKIVDGKAAHWNCTREINVFACAVENGRAFSKDCLNSWFESDGYMVVTMFLGCLTDTVFILQSWMKSIVTSQWCTPVGSPEVLE